MTLAGGGLPLAARMPAFANGVRAEGAEQEWQKGARGTEEKKRAREVVCVHRGGGRRTKKRKKRGGREM